MWVLSREQTATTSFQTLQHVVYTTTTTTSTTTTTTTTAAAAAAATTATTAAAANNNNNKKKKALFSNQSKTHCAVQTSYDKNHINIHFKQTES